MEEIGRSERTVQRYQNELVEAGVIAIGTIITKKTARWGIAILPHPALLEWIRETTARFKRSVQVVIKDVAGSFLPSKMAEKTTKMSPLFNYKEGSEVSAFPPAPKGGTPLARRRRENMSRLKRKKVRQPKTDSSARLESYRETMRLYRMLYREMPGENKEVFWDLTDYLRRTGRWPDMEQMASGEYCCDYSRQEILHYLGTLEAAGFLSLSERRMRFPIARLNAAQDGIYLKLVEICVEKGEATVTLDNVMAYIFQEYQQEQMFFKELQKDWEMLNFLRRKSQSEQLEPEEQEMLDMLVYHHSQETEQPSAATREEVKRQLGVLKKRGLLHVQKAKTENGKTYVYQLLPTAELAEQLVFNDWDTEPWTEFSLQTN